MNKIASTRFAGALRGPATEPPDGQNGNGALPAIFDAIWGLSTDGRLEAALRKAQRCLDQVVHHDHLTGLPNRLFLSEYLSDVLAHAAPRRQALAVVSLDLDRFKRINAAWGHAAGDLLLCAVAQRMRATVHRDDLVVRMGNDEFVVVLRNVERRSQIKAAINRLLAALAAPFNIDGQPLMTSASAGSSLYPRDGATVCELLRNAGAALSHAKVSGRNNLQVYSPAMSRQLKQQASIESRLRLAIQNRQLDVHYQPIVDSVSRQVVVLEALVRWKDPVDGFISPDSFIGIAEETGLIVPLGELVLDRVLQDIGRWRACGCTTVPVAVNVSAVQLRRSDFPERLLEAIRSADLDPTMLQVELTESAAFERPEDSNGMTIDDPVTRLRELGIHVAIDDFGTRYSSLSYLKQWHVDSLKIDRAFVRDLATDSSDLAIVAAVCEMARRLGIPVVAEGVEDRQQLEKLREVGCPLIQGYLFSKPVTADECRRYLSGAPMEYAASADAAGTGGTAVGTGFANEDRFRATAPPGEVTGAYRAMTLLPPPPRAVSSLQVLGGRRLHHRPGSRSRRSVKTSGYIFRRTSSR